MRLVCLRYPMSPSENASRTRKACSAHRIFLPYQKSLFFTPNASENASRTTGGCSAHRVSIPYRRRAFPVPNAPWPMHIPCTPNPLYRVRWKTLCIFLQKLRLDISGDNTGNSSYIRRVWRERKCGIKQKCPGVNSGAFRRCGRGSNPRPPA